MPGRVILLHKPFRVLCQFSPEGDKRTLADWVRVPEVYPAGRLDYDSEGLVVLTADGALQHAVAHPRRKLAKTYLAQVEGEVGAAALERLARGVDLADGPTAPAEAERVDEPAWLGPRDPPIRFRASIPTSWVRLVLREGRNRQVRRMTAAVGHPTLRLVRVAVGPWELGDLEPGEWRWAEVPPGLLSPAAGACPGPGGPRPAATGARRRPGGGARSTAGRSRPGGGA
ncbi:MAG: pseudouridine synthase [Deferrisomatales bacterium]